MQLYIASCLFGPRWKHNFFGILVPFDQNGGIFFCVQKRQIEENNLLLT